MVFNFLLIFSYLIISIQDIKDREVYWFLFPVITVLQAILFYKKTTISFYYLSISINILIISLVVFILFLYAKYKMKLKFQEVIGLGDLLLFFGLTFAFPPITFIILFVCSLFFSLILYLLFKRKHTIPLAGYMCIFYILIYLAYWIGVISNLYML